MKKLKVCLDIILYSGVIFAGEMIGTAIILLAHNIITLSLTNTIMFYILLGFIAFVNSVRVHKIKDKYDQPNTNNIK